MSHIYPFELFEIALRNRTGKVWT